LAINASFHAKRRICQLPSEMRIASPRAVNNVGQSKPVSRKRVITIEASHQIAEI
jgi:hypothetical protein